jgi:hypothetical protein
MRDKMEDSCERPRNERVYRKPELKVLGDLAKLTQNVGNYGYFDGGGPHGGGPYYSSTHY